MIFFIIYIYQIYIRSIYFTFTLLLHFCFAIASQIYVFVIIITILFFLNLYSVHKRVVISIMPSENQRCTDTVKHLSEMVTHSDSYFCAGIRLMYNKIHPYILFNLVCLDCILWAMKSFLFHFNDLKGPMSMMTTTLGFCSWFLSEWSHFGRLIQKMQQGDSISQHGIRA